MGSALTSSEPLKFRNLGGTARQHSMVDRSSGTLKTQVRVTKVSRSAGMIIHHYGFSVRCRDSLVIDGETYFGFFHPHALAEQAGIRDAVPYTLSDDGAARARSFAVSDQAPFPDRRWRMVDPIEAFDPAGGPHGLGLIVGRNEVDPEAWFFKAHFLHDPVWPGSLGLESFLQLLKVVAAETWGVSGTTEFASPAPGDLHRWIYRGQVLPTSGNVTVQAAISSRDDLRRWLKADGWLLVDGKVIYQINDFTLRLDSR
jgi:3-hydroxymyristoyl/3-hydroxydecanoyl-(acyl carrier protein) dehydratase